MAYLVPVRRLDIDNYWPQARPFVLKSLEKINDGTTQDDIYRDLINKDKQLWVAYNENKIIGCVITEIINCQGSKKLFYYIVAGDNFNDWFNCRHEIEDWARSLECKKVEMCGRLGWQKRLEQDGYKLEYIGMAKLL